MMTIQATPNEQEELRYLIKEIYTDDMTLSLRNGEYVVVPFRVMDGEKERFLSFEFNQRFVHSPLIHEEQGGEKLSATERQQLRSAFLFGNDFAEEREYVQLFIDAHSEKTPILNLEILTQETYADSMSAEPVIEFEFQFSGYAGVEDSGYAVFSGKHHKQVSIEGIVSPYIGFHDDIAGMIREKAKMFFLLYAE